MRLSTGDCLILGVCLTVLITITSTAKFCGRPPLVSIAEGKWKSSPRPRNGRYKIGTIIKYRCKSNYQLRGVQKRKCQNGKWIPSVKKKTKCIPTGCGHFPRTNANVVTSHNGTVYPFTATVNYTCNECSLLIGPDQLVCNDTGDWYPNGESPYCKSTCPCARPPQAPIPGGVSTLNPDERLQFPVGFRVNYTCPTGYGLDGVPYRICQPDGLWYPTTTKHKCVKALVTCPDPGIPDNGFYHVTSFANYNVASFGCHSGYERLGNVFRTCVASNASNPFWDGQMIECKDQFENTEVLAAQFRESFIDRTVSCDKSNQSDMLNKSTIETSPIDTPHLTFCQGRTVVLGEGCVDLIYAVDCSLSLGKKGFSDSLDFVSKTVRLFDLSLGTERVSFLTYDTDVYRYLRFGDVNTTEEALQKVKNAKFCKGSTSVNAAFDYILDIVLPTAKNDCKIALFLLSDGENNWGGDPEEKADKLKSTSNVDIYTIAIGKNQRGWTSLKRIASGPDNFFAVKTSDDIDEFARKAIQVPLEYGNQCGRAASKRKKCKDKLEDHCRSSLGAWPWLVGIYTVGKNNSQKENIICGGALIGDCHVLTAAHCIDKRKDLDKDLMVVVGNTDRLVDEKTEETYKVDEILIHTDFNRDTLDYDIAILRLSCNVSYTSYVRRICLPDCNNTGDLYRTGKECVVAGWGSTDYEEGQDYHLSTHLHHIELPVADTERCKELSQYPITKRMFCAGDASGEKGVCKGDSGGPLFCSTEDEAGWIVTGVVSWGEGCKAARKYDIFTKICDENIRVWFQKQLLQYPCKICLDESGCSCKDKPTIHIV